MKKQRPDLKITKLRIARSKNFELSVDSLQLQPGSVTCLVGANGSGKTTLVESVVGLLKPTSGQIRIAGKDTTRDTLRVKRLLGYVPDDDNWIIPELTATEYFALLASVHGNDLQHDGLLINAAALAKLLNFTSFDQLLGSLSHGNKKKVQIIAGLLHSPKVLILDELRNGLDPIAIIQAEKLLRQQQRSGKTILAATHDLWWAERFADQIIMIKNGQVILQQSTRSIVRQSGSVESKFLELYES